MSKNRRLIIIYISTILFVVIFFAIYRGSIKGLIYRTFLRPKVINNHTFVDLSSSHNPGGEKITFFKMYEQELGIYGIKQKRRSIEYDIITLFLITDSGNATLVTDYTRDPHSIRKYKTCNIRSVEIGYLDVNDNFIEINITDANIKKILLRVETESGEVIII